jgi:Metalloenzyme superfamily
MYWSSVRKLPFFTSFVLFFSVPVFAQQKAENIIIVTLDGMRWQEVFKGADPLIAADKTFNQKDSAYIFSTYIPPDGLARRKALFPFLWTVLAQQGQLYGNRTVGNKVDNANPFWFSYPGYNEILTGFADTAVNSNEYPNNPNTTLFDFLQGQKKFAGRVAAFGAWEAFNRIFNEPRSGFGVFAAFDAFGAKQPTVKEQLLNSMLAASFKPFGAGECLDMFTHFGALEYLREKKPRALFIGYGETDEWAHAGRYKDYLDAAHQIDQWLQEIWSFVQADEQYKNKTVMLVTVDHGRGDIKKLSWTDHGAEIPDAHEIWFGLIGAGVPAKGEQTAAMQLYQQQFAQTMAHLLGLNFTANHPIGEAIKAVR